MIPFLKILNQLKSLFPLIGGALMIVLIGSANRNAAENKSNKRVIKELKRHAEIDAAPAAPSESYNRLRKFAKKRRDDSSGVSGA